jgi:hypothetical protein
MARCKRTYNANKLSVCNGTRQNEKLNKSSAHYECTSPGASHFKLPRANKGRVLTRNGEERLNDERKSVWFDESNTALNGKDVRNDKLARKDQVQGLKNPNKEQRDNERCIVYCDGLRSSTPSSRNRHGREPLGKDANVSNEIESKKHQHGRQVLNQKTKPELVNFFVQNESLNHRKKTHPQYKGRSASFHDSRVAIPETVQQRQQEEEKCFNKISSILKPSTYQKGKELRDDQRSDFDAFDGRSAERQRFPSGPKTLDNTCSDVEKSGTAVEREEAFRFEKLIDDLMFGLLTLPCMP